MRVVCYQKQLPKEFVRFVELFFLLFVIVTTYKCIFAAVCAIARSPSHQICNVDASNTRSRTDEETGY